WAGDVLNQFILRRAPTVRLAQHRHPCPRLRQRPTAEKIREKLASPNTLAFIIFAPRSAAQKLLGTRAMLRHTPGRTAVCLFEDNRAAARPQSFLIKKDTEGLRRILRSCRSYCGSTKP